jgi:glycerol uptake facilitator protein
LGTPPSTTAARCLAEAVGTFLLVFFGCGSVHAAVLMGAQSGVWQVAVVWGVAIMVAIYAIGAISGAHINPAITVALAVWGRFPPGLVLAYVLGQLAGAVVAAALLFVLFQPFLGAREQQRGVERGRPGSEVTAMCYGEYFPSPGGVSADNSLTTAEAVVRELEKQREQFGAGPAFLAELVGTLLLALVVFALSDDRNFAAPAARLGPVFIGLTVAILISVLAPLTQACFNPARDFGPRLVAWAVGWGEVALPGPRPPSFFTVYILAPVLGAVAGGGLYAAVLRPCLPAAQEQQAAPNP